MAYLQEQMKILRYDKRLLEINLKNGSITQDEYDKYLAQLADLENASEKLVLEENTQESQASAPAQSESPATMTPPNSDPFGSGF